MKKETSYKNKRRITNKIKRKTLRKGGSRYKGNNFRKDSRQMRKFQNKLAKPHYKRELKRSNDKLLQKQRFKKDSLLSPVQANEVILSNTRNLLENKLEDLSDLDTLYNNLGDEIRRMQAMKHTIPQKVYVRNLRKANYKLQLLFLIFAGLTTSALSSESDTSLEDIGDSLFSAAEKMAVKTQNLHQAVGSISKQYKQIKALTPLQEGSFVNLDNAARAACLTLMAPGPHAAVLGPACAIKAYADMGSLVGSSISTLGEGLTRSYELRNTNNDVGRIDFLEGETLAEKQSNVMKVSDALDEFGKPTVENLKFRPFNRDVVSYVSNKISDLPHIKEQKNKLNEIKNDIKEKIDDNELDEAKDYLDKLNVDEIVDEGIYQGVNLLIQAANEHALPRAVQLADMAGII